MVVRRGKWGCVTRKDAMARNADTLSLSESVPNILHGRLKSTVRNRASRGSVRPPPSKFN